MSAATSLHQRIPPVTTASSTSQRWPAAASPALGHPRSRAAPRDVAPALANHDPAVPFQRGDELLVGTTPPCTGRSRGSFTRSSPTPLRGSSCGSTRTFTPPSSSGNLSTSFSVDGSVRIAAGSSKTRKALSQCIARAPVSLSRLVVEDHAATGAYSSRSRGTWLRKPHLVCLVPEG